jgi:hypothetical protein
MTSKRQPTTLFTAILRVHEQTLLQKCFSERLIDSQLPEGAYVKQLAAAFQQTVTETFWHHRLAGFRLTMTGHYDPAPDEPESKARDTVAFEFSYVYDPALIKLHLVRLRATLNESVCAEYIIHGHPARELPNAPMVYLDLMARHKQLVKAVPNAPDDQHHMGMRRR